MKNLGDGLFERVNEKTGETKGFAIIGFKVRTKDLKEIILPLTTKEAEAIPTQVN